MLLSKGQGTQQGASIVGNKSYAIGQPTARSSKDGSRKTIKLSDYLKKGVANKEPKDESPPTSPNKQEHSADAVQVADAVIDTVKDTKVVDNEGEEVSESRKHASKKTTKSSGTAKQGSGDKTKNPAGATTEMVDTSSVEARSPSKDHRRNLADSEKVSKRKRMDGDDDDEVLPLKKVPRKKTLLGVRKHTTDDKTLLLTRTQVRRAAPTKTVNRRG